MNKNSLNRGMKQPKYILIRRISNILSLVAGIMIFIIPFIWKDSYLIELKEFNISSIFSMPIIYFVICIILFIISVILHYIAIGMNVVDEIKNR